jgi:hypothetical protein
MTHDVQATLRPLGPCLGGYKWALSFPTLEDALAATVDPMDVLWLYLALAAGSQGKKAALVPSMSALITDLILTAATDAAAAVTTQLQALATFAANTSIPPMLTPYAGTDPSGLAASNALLLFAGYAQTSTTLAQLHGVAQQILTALPTTLTTARNLRSYFTLATWAAIDAAT